VGQSTDDVTAWCSQSADNYAVEGYWEKDVSVIEGLPDPLASEAS
jgi:hypothetical protein